MKCRKTLNVCFFCIKSPVGVCAASVWAPTIGHLCLFLQGGSLETWRRLVIGWLITERSLLWRVLHGFWGFFLLPFQLNVECGTLKGHSECVKICVCVCLFVFTACFFFFFFLTNFTQRSLTKNQATSHLLKMGRETRFHSIFVCCYDLLKITEGNKKKKKVNIQCQKSHVGNNL